MSYNCSLCSAHVAGSQVKVTVWSTVQDRSQISREVPVCTKCHKEVQTECDRGAIVSTALRMVAERAARRQAKQTVQSTEKTWYHEEYQKAKKRLDDLQSTVEPVPLD